MLLPDYNQVWPEPYIFRYIRQNHNRGVSDRALTVRVGQNHTFIGIYGVHTVGKSPCMAIYGMYIYGVHTVFLAGKSPCIRPYTVCIYIMYIRYFWQGNHHANGHIRYVCIYGVHTVFLTGKSPCIRSYTVCIYIRFWPTLITVRDASQAGTYFCLVCITQTRSLFLSLMKPKLLIDRHKALLKQSFHPCVASTRDAGPIRRCVHRFNIKCRAYSRMCVFLLPRLRVPIM